MSCRLLRQSYPYPTRGQTNERANARQSVGRSLFHTSKESSSRLATTANAIGIENTTYLWNVIPTLLRLGFLFRPSRILFALLRFRERTLLRASRLVLFIVTLCVSRQRRRRRRHGFRVRNRRSFPPTAFRFRFRFPTERARDERRERGADQG